MADPVSVSIAIATAAAVSHDSRALPASYSGPNATRSTHGPMTPAASTPTAPMPPTIAAGASSERSRLVRSSTKWAIRLPCIAVSGTNSGALLAWLTAAAVAIAMLTLTGSATVAAALHRAYSLGWVGATVASGLLLLLPLPLETRTVVGLLCGPLVGIGVHLGALARAGRSNTGSGL